MTVRYRVMYKFTRVSFEEFVVIPAGSTVLKIYNARVKYNINE